MRRFTKLCALGALASLAACVPAQRVQFTPVAPATLGDQLRANMSAAEVRAALGNPPETLALRYGEDTPEPWDAFVMVYWGERDPAFVDNEHPKKHRLVLAVAGGDTLLDHWLLAPGSTLP